MFAAYDRAIFLPTSSMTNCCVHCWLSENVSIIVCLRDGSILKQLEDGEIDDRLAPRTRKAAAVFSSHKKCHGDHIQMVHPKTHETIHTEVMELQFDCV